ncbi:monothiol glutaredoxin-S2-like protein [Tanacetum coccineum]
MEGLCPPQDHLVSDKIMDDHFRYYYINLQSCSSGIKILKGIDAEGLLPSLSPFLVKLHNSYPIIAMATVSRLVTDKAVVIFSKSSCCICHSVRTLICSFGANPTVYELDEHPEGQKIEKELKALGCKPSVPAVFIGQELVGGANEIMSMHLKGKLVPLLIKERAIWL